MKLSPLTDQLRERFALPKAVQGLIVLSRDNNQQNKLQIGDLIEKVDQIYQFTDVESLAGYIEEAKNSGKKFILLKIRRGATSRGLITLPLE